MNVLTHQLNPAIKKNTRFDSFNANAAIEQSTLGNYQVVIDDELGNKLLTIHMGNKKPISALAGYSDVNQYYPLVSVIGYMEDGDIKTDLRFYSASEGMVILTSERNMTYPYLMGVDNNLLLIYTRYPTNEVYVATQQHNFKDKVKVGQLPMNHQIKQVALNNGQLVISSQS